MVKTKRTVFISKYIFERKSNLNYHSAYKNQLVLKFKINVFERV